MRKRILVLLLVILNIGLLSVNALNSPEKTEIISERGDVKQIKKKGDKKPIYDIPLSEDIQSYIYDLSKEYNVDFKLLLAIAYIETGGTYKLNLRSSSGDTGLFQINDVHKKWLYSAGVTDLYNPYHNSLAAVWIISDSFKKGSDINTSLMVYNMGLGGAKRCWNKGVYSTSYSKSVIKAYENIKIKKGE